jgi:hypothetical protein
MISPGIAREPALFFGMKGPNQQRRGSELDCSEKGRKRGGRGPDGNVKYPFSGNGPEINAIPNSTGLAFGKRALCPQGPAGLLSFCWKRLQTETRFWEKKRGGAKKIKMAKSMEIPPQAFEKVITFIRTVSFPITFFIKYITKIGI